MKTGKIKTLSLVLLVILVTAFSLLLDFISAEFSTSIFTDTAYWLNVASVQSAVLILIFMARALYKEKERNRCEQYQFLQKNLKAAYITLNERNLNGIFRDYIAEDNRARKLKKYLEKLKLHCTKYRDKIKRLDLRKRRIETRFKDKNKTPHGPYYGLILRRMKSAETELEFWGNKIDRAAEEVEFIRVRHIKYSYSILFHDAKEREEEENDPYAHEDRDIAFLILTKGLSVFAFGIIATSFVVFDLSFSWGMIYKAIVKLLQIVLGLYTGAVAGQDFIRRKMCAKLTTRFNYVKQFMEQRKTASE